MKSIKDTVKTLSPEEQELLKDLIDECSQREKDVSKIAQNTEKAIEKLEEISQSITENIGIIDQVFHELKRHKAVMEKTIGEKRLKSLPDETFFHA